MGPIHRRYIRSIKKLVSDLALDLSGYQVLTEVGGNSYLYLPIIACMVGAKVTAWAKDSSYGKAEETSRLCMSIAHELGVEKSLLIRENEVSVNDIAAADIITNSHVLRPLDKQFLQHAKSSCVIPLMFEAWELRDQDLDVAFCKKKGLKVAGTWENHPALQVFNYSGVLAVRLALNGGMEIYKNKILVWSDDHFGEVAEKTFKDLGASSVIKTTSLDVLKQHVADLDFVYICDYDETRDYLGENGLFSREGIFDLNPHLALIHLYGNVSVKDASKLGIILYPLKDGKAKVMTETLGHIGVEPIMKLHAASLKVAQEMLENKLSDLSQLIR